MTLGQEYLIFVTLLCIGVIQISSVFGSLKMMLFFESFPLSKIFGWITVIAPSIWFFRNGGRNLPDTAGGLSGGSQFSLFALGVLLAIAITFLFTSFKNFSNHQPSEYNSKGLPTLSHHTFVQAFWTNMRSLWKSHTG